MITIRRSTPTLLMAGVLASALAGCTQGVGTTTRHTEVAYLTTTTANPFGAQLNAGYLYGAGQIAGVSAKVVGPSTMDLAKQTEMLKQLIKTSVNGISLSMVGVEASDDTLGEATRKGIPMLSIDSPPSPGSGVQLCVANDNPELGRHLADLLADALPANAAGDVVLGTPRAGVTSLDLRAHGFAQEIRRRLPHVRVIGPLDTGDRPGSAQVAWSRLAQANPHALALASVGADGALIAGFKHAQHATWLAAAFDIDAASLQAVKRGDLLLISPEHFLKGAVGGRMQALYASRREHLPVGWVYIAGLSITAQNVDEIIAREASPQSRRAWFAPKLQAMFAKNGPPLRSLDQLG